LELVRWGRRLRTLLSLPTKADQDTRLATYTPYARLRIRGYGGRGPAGGRPWSTPAVARMLPSDPLPGSDHPPRRGVRPRALAVHIAGTCELTCPTTVLRRAVTHHELGVLDNPRRQVTGHFDGSDPVVVAMQDQLRDGASLRRRGK
jgi:hypothetical protein